MSKLEKFLFNQHIFDEPEDDEPEVIEEPPAPTFSEEDLEKARSAAYEKAYQKGREEALAEAKASHEEKIANVLQKISTDTGLLFAAEHERDELFEREVIRVCLSIFEKLYPVFMDTQGTEQLHSIIRTVLKSQEDQSAITIETSPEMVASVKDALPQIVLPGQALPRIQVQENISLSGEDCTLRWKDGGAVRESNALAEQIRNIMQDMLADNKIEPSLEKAHEIPPNDAIIEDNEPDSTAPIDHENTAGKSSAEDLEKPDE